MSVPSAVVQRSATTISVLCRDWSVVVPLSWGMAFFEYWLAVPANRWGSAVYSAAQLKTMQEVITLVVFAIFSVVYLKQGITWNHVVGFALIASGAYFIFRAPFG